MNIMLDGTALMPKRGHSTDAGLDLLSPVDTVIPAGGGQYRHSGSGAGGQTGGHRTR